MLTFFHGWRRKAGCVALVMACAVIGMWGRSQFYSDMVMSRVSGHDAVEIVLHEHFVCWNWIWDGEKGPKRRFVKDSRGRIQATVSYLIDPKLTVDWDIGSDQRPPMPDASYSLNWIQFRLGLLSVDPGEIRILTVPYWSVVWPLTLLSGFLILWKPRKRS